MCVASTLLGIGSAGQAARVEIRVLRLSSILFCVVALTAGCAAMAPAPVTPAPATLPPGTPAPTPSPGPLDLAGRAASDIPGTLVSLPVTITSVLDGDTKPRDVLRVHLQAGQALLIVVDSVVSLDIANPDSRSFATRDAYTGPWLCGPGCYPPPKKFVAAVTGDYYVAVSTYQSAVPYTLALSIE
jgi:hypothetical protein